MVSELTRKTERWANVDPYLYLAFLGIGTDSHVFNKIAG